MTKAEFHQELFDWDNGKKLKDSYTMEDLCNYFYLKFSTDFHSGAYLTKECLDKLKKSVIENADKLSLQQEASLEEYCNEHSLEVVLFAIDLSESFEDIYYKIPEAKSKITKLERIKKYGV